MDPSQLIIYLKLLWENITIEPVVFLYELTRGFGGIVMSELYLKKGCSVNLNYSMEICNNIFDHEDIQIETQKLVSGVQMTNSILQNIPSLLCTLLAGPLSDTYGRKPLILVSLFGYVIANVVFLINSIWFHQLKVVN